MGFPRRAAPTGHGQAEKVGRGALASKLLYASFASSARPQDGAWKDPVTRPRSPRQTLLFSLLGLKAGGAWKADRTASRASLDGQHVRAHRFRKKFFIIAILVAYRSARRLPPASLCRSL